jgi:hypothetical protein
MTITIKSNGEITSAKIHKRADGSIYSIEFDFIPPDLWSDLEIWLNDSKTDKFIDYAKMNLSKRNKMQFTKG